MVGEMPAACVTTGSNITIKDDQQASTNTSAYTTTPTRPEDSGGLVSFDIAAYLFTCWWLQRSQTQLPD